MKVRQRRAEVKTGMNKTNQSRAIAQRSKGENTDERRIFLIRTAERSSNRHMTYARISRYAMP